MVEADVRTRVPQPGEAYGEQIVLDVVSYLKGSGPSAIVLFMPGGAYRPPAGTPPKLSPSGHVIHEGISVPGAMWLDPGDRVVVMLRHTGNSAHGHTYHSISTGLFLRVQNSDGTMPYPVDQARRPVSEAICGEPIVVAPAVVPREQRPSNLSISSTDYAMWPPFVDVAMEWTDFIASTRSCLVSEVAGCSAIPATVMPGIDPALLSEEQ